MWRNTLLSIVALLFVFACAEPESVRVAVMMPLAAEGAPRTSLPNLEWAKDTVNQAGGIGGRKLVFDYFDIQKDTLSSVAQRIAQDPSYPAVIGAGTSEMLLSVSDDFVRYRKPLVSFTSTSAEVLRAAARKGIIWRTRQSDIAQTEVMLRYAQEQGAKKVGLLCTIDTNGKTFFDWWGFLATELGYSQDAVHSETIEGNDTCDAAVTQSIQFAPDILFAAVSTVEQQQCILRAVRDQVRVIFADTGLDPLALLPPAHAMIPPPRIEGISPTAQPDFTVSARAHFGRDTAPIAAAEYDAALWVAYGLAASHGQGGDDLISALKSISDGTEAESLGWDENGVRAALSALADGQRPSLQGASGPLHFERDLYVDLRASHFGHFLLTPQGIATDRSYDTGSPEFLTRQGVLVHPDLASLGIPETGSYQPAANKQDSWALIAALSSGWNNYRHQADALRQYQLLRQRGIADDHIILILDDKIATASQNPQPNVIVNQPGGENLHRNLEIDYDLTVSAQDVADILTGTVSARTPRVLSLSAGSDLYVYLVGHGGKQGISIGGNSATDGLRGVSALTPTVLRQALCLLRSADRLRRAWVVIESCYGGVFGDAQYGGVEALCGGPKTTPLMGVALLSAASPSEVSYAADYDPDMSNWVNDAFSKRYAEQLEAQPNIDLLSLYRQVFVGVSGSHASMYNAKNAGSLGSIRMTEFVSP